MAISPTAEGFRATVRAPSLTLAEVAWRWVFGATAFALFFFGLFEYLDTLHVTNRELLFLRTEQPYLVVQAIAHILRGGLSRALFSLVLAALLLAILWIFAASAGRSATVRALSGYFRDMASRLSAVSIPDVGERGNASNVSATNFIALGRLHFLRIVLGIALLLGLLAADIIAGFASPPKNPQPGLAFILFVPIALLVLFTAWALNWFLSVAAVFAVRNGDSAVDAMSSAVSLCRERTGAVLAVSTWTGLAHLVAFVAASTVVSMLLGFAPLLPWRLVVLIVALITLAYFAIADWLYMARLAGYVCILEIPEALMKPTPPVRPALPPAPPVQTTIDRNELILSDVPQAVTS